MQDTRDPGFKDARNLLWYVIKHVIPGAPEPTPVQYEICDEMQRAIEHVVFQTGRGEGQNKLVVEGFRGVAKSLIASVITVWALYWRPELNVLVVSASKERADAFSTFTLRIIRELPALQWLKPGQNARDSMMAFDVGPAPAAHAPSVKSVGITGMITGSRADIIIVDDVEVPNNSETETKRIKLAELVKELFGAVAKPICAAIYLGTPQIEESLYRKLTSERGYRCVIWPAEFCDASWMEEYGAMLSPMLTKQLLADPSLVGKPTDPQRFNEYVLDEKRLEYGKTGYDMQFKLDTRMSDAARYPLKLADLIVLDFGQDKAPLEVQWSNSRENLVDNIPSMGLGYDRLYRPSFVSDKRTSFEASVMAIDPAGRGNDELAVCIGRLCGGLIYVPYWRGYFGGYGEENLKAIALSAKAHKVKLVLVEDNFGNGMFTALLIPVFKQHYPECTIEETHSIGQKEKRIIDTLEPVLNAHRLVVSASALLDDLRPLQGVTEAEAISYRLQHQLTRITRDRGCLKHDDRVDALAMLVAYFVNFMKSTEEAARKRATERDFEDEIESWYKDSSQKVQPSPTGHRSNVERFLNRPR